MLTNIRKPENSDLNYLLDIDLKCFEDNLSSTEWRETLLDPKFGLLIGTYQGLPVGFIVWHDMKVITRLAVKKLYRARGVGSQLLSAVELLLVQQSVSEVQFPVTESLCCLEVGRWLIKRGYHTGGLLRNAGVYCGSPEDQILFRKLL